MWNRSWVSEISGDLGKLSVYVSKLTSKYSQNIYIYIYIYKNTWEFLSILLRVDEKYCFGEISGLSQNSTFHQYITVYLGIFCCWLLHVYVKFPERNF